jgi:hypothetical protein
VESETNGQWTAVFGDEAAPHLLKIKDIIKLDANPTQKGTPAANAIKELPASLQSHPAIYAMNVRALRNSYDKDPSAERTNQYINLLANPVTQDKNKPMPFALMAEIYHKQNMIKECDEAITNAHKQMKDGYLRFQLAKWRLGRGDIPGAETAYGQAKMEAPGIKALFVFGKKLEEKKANP